MKAEEWGCFLLIPEIFRQIVILVLLLHLVVGAYNGIMRKHTV